MEVCTWLLLQAISEDLTVLQTEDLWQVPNVNMWSKQTLGAICLPYADFIHTQVLSLAQYPPCGPSSKILILFAAPWGGKHERFCTCRPASTAGRFSYYLQPRRMPHHLRDCSFWRTFSAWPERIHRPVSALPAPGTCVEQVTEGSMSGTQEVALGGVEVVLPKIVRRPQHNLPLAIHLLEQYFLPPSICR